MMAWRIDYEPHVKSNLSGLGSRRYGGRWSRKGVAMVYLSSSLSLAAFEKFVHAQPRAGVDLHAVSVEVPGSAVEEAKRPRLSAWRSPEPLPDTIEWGSQWAATRESLVAIVPSVLLPRRSFERNLEFNLLLNPAHPDMRHVRVIDRMPYVFDPCEWGSRLD
jgi:RES domain-containing protein